MSNLREQLEMQRLDIIANHPGICELDIAIAALLASEGTVIVTPVMDPDEIVETPETDSDVVVVTPPAPDAKPVLHLNFDASPDPDASTPAQQRAFNSSPTTVDDFIYKALAAGQNQMTEIVAFVMERRASSDGSIRQNLYKLRKRGLLYKEGDNWFPT